MHFFDVLFLQKCNRFQTVAIEDSDVHILSGLPSNPHHPSGGTGQEARDHWNGGLSQRGHRGIALAGHIRSRGAGHNGGSPAFYARNQPGIVGTTAPSGFPQIIQTQLLSQPISFVLQVRHRYSNSFPKVVLTEVFRGGRGFAAYGDVHERCTTIILDEG